MRLRQRDLKPFAFKKWQKVTEPDGTTYDGWGDSGTLQANVQPAGGKFLVELYGGRLNYMKVAYLESLTDLRFSIRAEENDGVCIDVTENDDPDYKIVAIRPWGDHFVLDLEKLVVKK